MDKKSGTTPDPDDAEGVRIIGPDEAAEAAERTDIAKRRPQDQPKFGDRPTPAEKQPKGPRPTLRFPLSDAASAGEIARPRVRQDAPPPRSPAPSPDPPVEDVPAPAGAIEADLDEEHAAVDEDDDKPRSLFSVGSEPGSSDPPGDEMAEVEEEREADEPGSGDDTAPIRIPHWTEPATGEVPAVIAGEGSDDAWESFTDGAPRWRDEGKDFDERDDIAALADEEGGLGALDPDAPGEEEMLAFTELDELEKSPPARTRPPEPAAAAPAKKKKKKKQQARPPEQGAPRAPGGDPRKLKKMPAGGAKARPAQSPKKRPPGGRGPGGPTGPSGGSDGRDLPTAIGVGAGIGVLGLVLLKIGSGAMIVMVTALVVLAAAEFFTTLRRAGYQPAQLLGIVGCAVLPVAAMWKGELAYPVALGLIVMAGFLWYVIGAGEERAVMGLGVTMLGVLWIGLLASFGGLLLGVPGQGPSLFLAAVLVAVAYDVGAFFVGRSMGQAPLTDISPGKTVEGLAGGIVAGILVSIIVVGPPVASISPFGDSLPNAFWLGLVVSVAAATGDICQSVLKRDLGLKDMGSLIPGHGGVLDRMDGILFALPAAWYLGLVLL